MLSVAPASVLLLGVIGMLIVAFSVARMAAEERRYRGPVTVARYAADGAQRPAPPAARLPLTVTRRSSSDGPAGRVVPDSPDAQPTLWRARSHDRPNASHYAVLPAAHDTG